MGTKIPPIIEPPPADPGNPCVICWGPGKDFGSGDTPDKISISFSGINKNIDWEPWMLDPYNEKVDLDQDEFAPCHFRYVDDNFIIDCTFLEGNTDVILEGKDGGFQFISPSASKCSEFVFNERNIRYVNGSALITIPEV